MENREDLVRSSQATEADLRAALAGVDVGSEVSAEVVGYLGHNELGLAFATLVEAIDERAILPSATTIERLRAASERMGRPRDGAQAWARLEQ